ncbi:cyclin-D4-2-like [Impatiens glandulifera]|uniref:cyclin-D4-2-like n=1 Tax=Impatiens glandulifera TaxID=253017 RepID=UPI001FB19ACE|nr:cyclin-D4-2-like [Impatiens glandulifera]
MEPSFDYVGASLLCAENGTGVFEDGGKKDHQDKNFDETLNWRLPEVTDESMGLMLERENEYLLSGDYLDRLTNGDFDFLGRTEAVNWIAKVHVHFNFSPICAYLSINYMDRFLSAYESELLKGKAWMMQLLAVACVSIAAKMEETVVPLSLDLQIDGHRPIFEGKTIQRMELLVLTTLKWRMKAITPFCFLDFFQRKMMNKDDKDDDGKRFFSRCSIHKSTQIILNMIVKGNDLLEFKPSEIAAAVTMSVVGEVQTVDFQESISGLIHYVEKERLLKCFESVQKASSTVAAAAAAVSSVPQSPNAVLDAAYLSYNKTDGSSTTSLVVGSCSNTLQSSSSVN